MSTFIAVLGSVLARPDLTPDQIDYIHGYLGEFIVRGRANVKV